ncbi:cytochrome P450 [Sphingobium sp. CFD-2]|uniref:cytochrome P450 n=1 Tax=Sphingobium sp. CFD-2 TaxID=2878542 RepID=UPI00214B0854|nr:cytochrome P450 [Sphingobium sp. CFD-2]
MIVPQEIAETVVDPKAYADGRIHEAYRWLRRNAPFAKIAPAGYDPFWIVTRQADIMAVEVQSDLFCNSQGLPAITSNEMRAQLGDRPGGFRTIVSMDGVEHQAYRRLTQGALMPKTLRILEGRIREIARVFIEKMAQTGGRCDFAQDVAFLYPLRVVMEVLGVSEKDEAFWLTLTQAGNTQNSKGTHAQMDDTARAEAMKQYLTGLNNYFVDIITDRRANPREDMATRIANGEIKGELIGNMEAMGYYIIFASAGHDTTSASTAGGMAALAGDPEQFRKLKDNPVLIPGYVEESIRWVAPVKHFARTVTADTEFNGQQLAKGERLMLCFASGTRDEDAFTDPDRFDIERSPNRHVGFGYGPHLCLGQHLAKLEMRIFWEELLPRLQNVELDGPVIHPETTSIAGPQSVPIKFVMS